MKLLSKIDFTLVIFPLLIFSLGALAILSTSRESFESQLSFFLMGILLYIIVCFVDIKKISLFSTVLLYFAGFASLVGLFVFGDSIRGSVRWYVVGGINFQPSEAAKVFLILLLAKVFSVPWISRNFLARVLIGFVLVAGYFFPVYKEPDLGTALVIGGIWLFVLVSSGIKLKYVFVGISVILLSLFPLWRILKDYQKERVFSFINPYSDPLGKGYNVIQAITAAGSGQIFGRGFGRGTQSHLNFLPEHKTDFIFSAFSEEWGFAGSVLLLFFYFLLLLRIVFLIKSASDASDLFVLSGVFSVLFLQCLVNVGMNIGVLPVTGIPLPLFSYGGSSLIFSMALLGFAQGVAMRRNVC